MDDEENKSNGELYAENVTEALGVYATMLKGNGGGLRHEQMSAARDVLDWKYGGGRPGTLKVAAK